MHALLWRRASPLLAGLLIVSAVVAQVVSERTTTEGPPLSSHDAGPGGALALARWLERLGYTVDRLEPGGPTEFAFGGILFVLEPARDFGRVEAGSLLSWVRRGGVLVYVPNIRSTLLQLSPAAPGNILNEELGISLVFGPFVDETSGSFPFFTTPPASRFAVETREGLELRNDAWDPLISDEGRILAASRQLDAGRVYVAVSDALFANSGIGERDNPAFLLNILARHPDARTVLLEEAHHAELPEPGLMAEVRASPWGWALIYASMLTAGFLFWAGRRFGPPVVAVREPARSTGEYVTAFAGLLQRAQATAWTQSQLAQVFRRRLARSLGARSDAPAGELGALFGARHADGDTVGASLAALDGPALRERDLLTHVRTLEEKLRRARATAPASSAAADLEGG
jgi:Domain of unknown function (DUF4350)